MQQKHSREIADKEEISFLKTVIAKVAAWFPRLREMLRIEKLCHLVEFDERQTATLVKEKPLSMQGNSIRRNTDGNSRPKRQGFKC